jgi:hypothetical protein
MGNIKVARWTYYTGNLWGIFKNRHLSNATGRIRDESLINQGGRDPNSLQIFNFFVSMEMRGKNQSHVAVHYLR